MFKNIKTQFLDELADIKNNGMWKEEKIISGYQGAEIDVEGKKFLNFCSNNYLGLAGGEEMKTVAKKGIDTYGFGMASVRFICGTQTVHKDLEKKIADFFSTEDAIIYTSCFDANTGLFETILQEGDVLLSDELNHASIIDGIRLCKAERIKYVHSNMDDLEAKLRESVQKNNVSAAEDGKLRKILIATDGVFSMDGEVAKLQGLTDLAETYGAMLMVDDSHGSGVLGNTGRGSVEGFMDKIDILTSTFGKALGGAGGGFTAGRKEIIELLRQRSRTTLFSNSLPPVIAYNALYVLNNYDNVLSHLRKTLNNNTVYVRSKMEELGFTLGGSVLTSEAHTRIHPITPVMLYDEKLATNMAAKLFEKGIYVRGFTYPVVPKGKARIRVQLSAAHTKQQMDSAIHAFEEVGKELDVLH